MAFDLDAYREAHALWTFTANRRIYTALPVSAEHVLEYQRRCTGVGVQKQHAALRWLLRQAFPWRPSYMWLGDPVHIIAGTRPNEQKTLLADFFVSLAGSPPTEPESPTSGTDSPR